MKIDGATLLEAVDLGSSFVPSFIEGSVEGTTGTTDLAVALNGKIAAVTKTFDQRGQTRFSALVPEQAFRNGSVYVATSSGTEFILNAYAGVGVLGSAPDQCTFGGSITVVNP